MGARLSSGGTADLILDAAEVRAQVVGFNGFSYADVANELGVTTASLHYHFPSKSDLGVRLIERYTARFLEALADIVGRKKTASAQLDAYVAIYAAVLAGGRMCLCGILAAEYETLPPSMREQLRLFFEKNEDWLSALLERGRASGDFAYESEPRVAAAALIAGLEGAMLVARVRGGVESFRNAAALMVRNIRNVAASAEAN